jgi:Arc/MetJ-type ribon-helix-helix transcriptional regulator
MRPQINGILEERCETVADTYGYASAAEFVRDAVRRRCEELEDASTLSEFAGPLSDAEADTLMAAIEAARELEDG